MKKIAERVKVLTEAREARHRQIFDMLKKCRGNITVTAEMMGLSRQRLTKLLDEEKLQDYARELRVYHGASFSGRGRPKRR